ncbi:MAG: Ran-binding zinc finger domain-containing protein [Actinomycetota bacterium]
MDEELFQILSLFLLLGLLLTLFGVLQSLGAIRKAMENVDARGPRPEASPAPASEASAAAEGGTAGETGPAWARPDGIDTGPPPTAAATPAAERTGWPSPQEATAIPSVGEETPSPEPAQETSPARESRQLYADAGLAAATPSESALRPAGQEEPAENPFETAPEPRQEEPEPEPQGAPAEDPQEQPFERDGRWWFRRGDELLVYEEQSGQWVSAAEPSKTGSLATGATGTTESAAPAEGAGAAAGQVTTQLEPAGSFWKCPSCGAVNGSTATSCRMCFTARP